MSGEGWPLCSSLNRVEVEGCETRRCNRAFVPVEHRRFRVDEASVRAGLRVGVQRINPNYRQTPGRHGNRHSPAFGGRTRSLSYAWMDRQQTKSLARQLDGDKARVARLDVRVARTGLTHQVLQTGQKDLGQHCRSPQRGCVALCCWLPFARRRFNCDSGIDCDSGELRQADCDRDL